MKYINLKRIAIISVPIACILIFCILYYLQEEKVSDKLKECSFYTVAFPVKMAGSHTMHFKFFHDKKEYKDITNVGAGDLGYNYTSSSAMKNRYWVQVYCKNFTINRINWGIKVPDTLHFIPTNGWNKIPDILEEGN